MALTLVVTGFIHADVDAGEPSVVQRKVGVGAWSNEAEQMGQYLWMSSDGSYGVAVGAIDNTDVDVAQRFGEYLNGVWTQYSISGVGPTDRISSVRGLGDAQGNVLIGGHDAAAAKLWSWNGLTITEEDSYGVPATNVCRPIYASSLELNLAAGITSAAVSCFRSLNGGGSWARDSSYRWGFPLDPVNPAVRDNRFIYSAADQYRALNDGDYEYLQAGGGGTFATFAASGLDRLHVWDMWSDATNPSDPDELPTCWVAGRKNTSPFAAAIYYFDGTTWSEKWSGEDGYLVTRFLRMNSDLWGIVVPRLTPGAGTGYIIRSTDDNTFSTYATLPADMGEAYGLAVWGTDGIGIGTPLGSLMPNAGAGSARSHLLSATNSAGGTAIPFIAKHLSTVAKRRIR